MKEALLVIDIDSLNHWDDEGWLKRNGWFSGMPAVLEIINKERDKGGVILFSVLDYKHPEHTWDQTSHVAIDGYECIGCDIRFASRLAPFLGHKHGERFEPVFAKQKNNAFTNEMLPRHLRAHGIEKVKLIGCNTFQCIKETAVGAVENGFHVVLLERATFSPFNQKEDREWWRETVMYYHSSKGTSMSVTVE